MNHSIRLVCKPASMQSIRRLFLLIVSLFISAPCCQLSSAQRPGYVQDDTGGAIKEMRGTLDDLRHRLNNHETEIRMYDEKLSNLDTIIESVRDQLNDSSKQHKEQLKGSSSSLESKIASLETASKGLSNDMKQFKTHANDTSAALAQCSQKLSELEKSVEQQNKNIEHLQSAMRSLMQAIHGEATPPGKGSDVAEAPSAPVASGNTYRVKAGDSLEKIARSHQTTIQALKDLNGLSSDKIVVGKLLLIPEK